MRPASFYLTRAIRYRVRERAACPRARLYYLARLAVLKARALRDDGKGPESWRVPLAWARRTMADYRALRPLHVCP